MPIKPDPSKIVVPNGYKVGVFAAGLDTPSAATVDGDGNVWVAISGPLFMPGTKPPHVKVFDKTGKLIKEIGKGIVHGPRDERASASALRTRRSTSPNTARRSGRSTGSTASSS